MTYEEAREFINQSNKYGIVPGLETITELLKRLGNPQDKLKIIHVAGTNGKGSTCSFITGILTAAGYRVGRYISPSVFSYRERIQIAYRSDALANDCSIIKNNRVSDDKLPDNVSSDTSETETGDNFTIEIEYISKEGVCETVERILPVCEAMVREGFAHPTSFEIETAMTMLYLMWRQVDFAVIEVGMGGRLDATNVIRHPVCTVITSISMDHMQYLGNTLEKIAREKAGIIKAGSPVITGWQKTEVLNVIKQQSKDLGAPIYLADDSSITDIDYTIDGTSFTIAAGNSSNRYRIKLIGEYQPENAALAVETAQVLEVIGYPIGQAAIANGLSHTFWSGRFEIVARNPYLIIDGAHNEDAAKTLRKSIQLYFTNRRIIYIIGVLADKDYGNILKITAPLADTIITLTPDNGRALGSDQLAQVARQYCPRVVDAGDVSNAVTLAYREAKEEDVIIAFGSLSFLGELVSSLGIRKDDEYDR